MSAKAACGSQELAHALMHADFGPAFSLLGFCKAERLPKSLAL
jgi:hypothetical protein